MAHPNNSLCENGLTYCPAWGKCAAPGSGCPQAAYLPNVTDPGCILLAKQKCLTIADSFQAAACVRAVEAPMQSTAAMTSKQLADMLYFPEATLRGQIAGRLCLSGPGPDNGS